MVVAYEAQLNQDWEFATSEGDKHFQNSSAPLTAMRRIAHRLNSLGIPYAVAGAMALNLHGFRRFTDDVDILVTREGLSSIHEKLVGPGYAPPLQRQ